MAISLVATLLACGGGESDHWRVPARAEAAVRSTGTLVLERRIAGEVLGQGVRDAILLDGGRIAALVLQDCKVTIFGPSGDVADSLPARCGRGPGELSDPLSVTRWRSGALLVWDGDKRGFVVIDPATGRRPGRDLLASPEVRSMEINRVRALDDTTLLVLNTTTPAPEGVSTNRPLGLLRVHGDSVTLARSLAIGHPEIAWKRKAPVATSIPGCLRLAGSGLSVVALSKWSFDVLEVDVRSGDLDRVTWGDHGVSITGVQENLGEPYSRVLAAEVSCDGGLIAAGMQVGERRGPNRGVESTLLELRDSALRPILRQQWGAATGFGVPVDLRNDLLLFRDNSAPEGPVLHLLRYRR